MTVSLLGDGIYFVTIAWQVYDLSDAPTALSVVGVAWTVPQVVFLLLGGVVSDRVELTGPIAEWVGVRETLVGAGLLSGAITLAFLFLPGMRDEERGGVAGRGVRSTA